MMAPLLAGACVSIALGVAGSSAPSPAPSFAGPRAYKAGKKPWRIAIADLNGDTRPDLAVAAVNHASVTDSVSVLTNIGGGNFHRSGTYKLGKGPESLVAADLNGDAWKDLAIANVSSDTVSVLLNTRDGAFRPRRDYQTGGSPQGLAVADLDGDLLPDLAVANWYSNSVSVLLNRGDGTFAPRHDYAAGGHPNRFVVTDLNGDGKPDLAAAAAFTGSLSVLLNRGGGNFGPRRAYAVGTMDHLAVGDLNRDGRPDVVTANGTSEVSLSLNTGGGAFGATREYVSGKGSRQVAIGDLNRDGAADLATANDPGTVSVLLNRGDASFGPPRDYRTGRDPAALALADLDRDGWPDLVTANRAGSAEKTLTVLANRGNGTFTSRNFEAATGPSELVVGDLNGDRLSELVTANDAPNAVFVLANATGRCGVPKVRRELLAAARREIARANCRVGAIRWTHSRFKRGRVLRQRPTSGAVLPAGGAVRLVVSRGRRH
jgi:FG-GAP-like repeat